MDNHGAVDPGRHVPHLTSSFLTIRWVLCSCRAMAAGFAIACGHLGPPSTPRTAVNRPG